MKAKNIFYKNDKKTGKKRLGKKRGILGGFVALFLLFFVVAALSPPTTTTTVSNTTTTVPTATPQAPPAPTPEKPKDDGLTVITPVDVIKIDNGPLGDMGFDFLIEDKEGNLYVMYLYDMQKVNAYNNGDASKPFKAEYKVLGDSGAPYHKNTREILTVYDMNGKEL